MSAPALAAGEHLRLAEFARLLSERGVHRLPIVGARNKRVGLITRTDLIAALRRSMAGSMQMHDAP